MFPLLLKIKTVIIVSTNVDFHDREAWEWEEYEQIVEIFPKMVILEGSDTEVD